MFSLRRMATASTHRCRDASALAAHVGQVCAERRITWSVASHYRGGASPSSRRIRTPAVRGQVSYLIALHEIAHVVLPSEDGLLRTEAACWRWALDHSLVEPTPRTRRSLCRRLLSYLARALRREPATVPPPGDDFWELVWRLDPRAKHVYDAHIAHLEAARPAAAGPA